MLGAPSLHCVEIPLKAPAGLTQLPPSQVLRTCVRIKCLQAAEGAMEGLFPVLGEQEVGQDDL